MAQTYRVGTYNVQHGRRSDGVVDVGLLADACAALGCDVLALQEVDVGVSRSGSVDLAAAVAERTGTALAFGPACPLEDGEYGNALLVRGRILVADNVPLPGRPGDEPRAVLVARVELAAGPSVSVAATHLSVNAAAARAQLQAVLERFRGEPEPRILLGDLNLEATVVAAPLAGLGLLLVGGRATFPGHRPRRRIDHVAISGATVRGVTTPEVPVSDHRPVVVDLLAA